jgi:HEPN domain-containing protein
MSEKRVASFLQLAEEGLRTANLLLQEEQFRDAAYFAQQVAERIARALLDHAGVPFGTSHNIGQMAASLPAGHPFKNALLDLDDLSPAATKYRYPTPGGRLADPPPAEAIQFALDRLAVLLTDAKAYISRAAAGPR